jgi:hypothetical protein
MGEMDTLETFQSSDLIRMLPDASSPNISMSMDMLVMGFKLFEKQQRAASLDCEPLRAAARSQIPTKLDDLSGSKLDDCSEGKGCLRNRLYLYISHLIGRSRAFHTLLALKEVSYSFARENDQLEQLDYIWRNALTNFDLQTEILNGEQNWYELVTFLGQITQENIGTGGFNPNTNRNLTSSGGGSPEVEGGN